MILDTIVAPATPYGIGGIAVVRLSGPQSLIILRKLFNNNSLEVKHKTAVFVNLFNENGFHLDESVCTFFKAPNSYTGEDVVEISCHGNPLIVEKLVSACVHFGARLADPGEFTRRSFINGKLDLIQAESVSSLIHSKSIESSRLNLRLLNGELSDTLNNVREQLIKAASLVEFELDISEDELQPDLHKQLSIILTGLNQKIEILLGSYSQARLLNRGALVVIAGEPNVGKSTLLNALSKSNRAITSSLPGTTRDAIDVPMILDGVPINLIDTAGIRDSSEKIEAEGVRRSVDYMNRADLVIFVKDISLSGNDIIHPENVPFIEVINKIDLLTDSTTFVTKKGNNKLLAISAKTGTGLKLLRNQIKKALGISSSLTDTVSITTTRQHLALKNCHDKLKTSFKLLSNKKISYELVSIELREALDNIGEILGKATPDDILNNIFNNFCVGK